MNSQPTQPDLEREHNSTAPSSVEDENSTLTEETTSEEKTEASEKQSVRIEIPEPDADNITVLTDKLPNKPILPWNHYDSPWEGSETEAIPEENQSSDDPVDGSVTPIAPSLEEIIEQED